MRKVGVITLVVALCLVGLLPAKGVAVVAPHAEADTLPTPLYHYTEGLKELLIRGDSAAAQRAWEQALALDSTYAPAHYKLGELLLRTPATEARGIAHTRRAYEADTTNKFYLAMHAYAELYGGHFEHARKAFYRLIPLDRHNSEHYRLTALLEEQLGDRRAAIALLDSAEVLFGHNSRLGSLKQRLLIAEGRSEEALQQAQKQVEAIPYEAEGHLALGEIYARMGEDSLSLAAMGRAFELDSTSLETLLTLADFHLSRNHYDDYLDISRRLFEHDEVSLSEKVSIFERFTADGRFYREFWPRISTLARTLAMRYPKEPRVVALYGNHLLRSGGVEQALGYYKSHLNDEPRQLDYFTMVVDIESYLEHPDSAEHYLNRAILHFPDELSLHLQKGHFRALYRHDETAARAAYEEALTRASTDSLRSVVWGFMGDSHQRVAQGEQPTIEAAIEQMKRGGEGSRAIKKAFKACYKAYDKALLYNPDNQGVLNNYAYFLSLEERDLERALTMSSRAIALSEGNPTYLDTHAWVLHKLGRHEEAKRLLQQALSLDGQRSAELQMHYGDVLAALNELFMAEVYWKRALANGYDPEAVERRLEQLKQINEK